jgi:hypothetical protein
VRDRKEGDGGMTSVKLRDDNTHRRTKDTIDAFG